ncbi:intercellular adhesion molecule 5 isoform X2 [Engraulis encrasicolus]|uniref:intercellular adhesion molecule 5 isoform X2 n=1 Tax=Engraulis encrasicolus TaxID=184585 RepID=UPI002FD12083
MYQLTRSRNMSNRMTMSLWLVLGLGNILLLSCGAEDQCPFFQLYPPVLVVEYNSSLEVEVNCTTSSEDSQPYWENLLPFTDESSTVLTVSALQEWDLIAQCVVNTTNPLCREELSVTVYKLPDSVSITTVGEEGLRCDVMNVAPAQNLTVHWYKRNTRVGKSPFNATEALPLNVSADINVTQDGGLYWCETELDLGPHGPQPPPKASSNKLRNGCPIEISPPSLLVRYGDPALATCRALVPSTALGWNSTVEPVDMEDGAAELYWTVDEMRDWSVESRCVITMEDGYECSKELPIIVYSAPKNLSVTLERPGALAAGNESTLTCYIENIAPIHHLTIRWFKGDSQLLEDPNLRRNVEGLQNITSVLRVKPDIYDNMAEYRCEADLNLGPAGSPKLTSVPFKITVYTGCPVEISPQSLVVRYGESAMATCRALVPGTEMGWESTVGPVGMKEGVTSLNWTVKELREWTVKPQCFIKREDGEQCSKELKVSIYNIPDGLRITPNYHGPVEEGKELGLHCHIENIAPVQNLTIRWLKGDMIIFEDIKPQSRKTVGTDNITSDYIFSPRLSDDGAQYRCEAELELSLGSPPKLTSEPFNLTVYSGCPINISPPTLVVKYGEAASAECTTFVPHDGIGWNSTLEPVDAVAEVQNVTWSVKELTEWTVNPTCVIEKDGELCGKDLSVVVYSSPDNISVSAYTSGAVVEGRQYSLFCHIQNVAPVQNLTVRWFRGDMEISVTNSTAVNSGDVGAQNVTTGLLIEPAMSDNGAQYRCEAELVLGPGSPPKLTSEPFSITVYTGCPIEISPPSLLVRYGDPALATCRALVPSTALGWNSTVEPVDMEDGAAELNWTVDEMREWSVESRCVITMEDGYECSKELPIIVYSTLESADVTSNPPGAAGADKNYTLRCHVQNVAPLEKLEVEWFKGDQSLGSTQYFNRSEITPQNITDEMQITPGMSDNQAQYRCAARLTLGPGESSKVESDPFTVTVYTGCPVVIDPPSLVVRYGESALTTCHALVPNEGMGWESTVGPVGMKEGVTRLNWTVKELREWTVKPQCFINTAQDNQCQKELPVTVYSAPDSVHVTSSRLGPLAEGKDYTLSCNIKNIAPAQNLTIRWYKGQTKIREDRPHASHTLPEPLNATSELHIQPHTSDDGAQYRCEAELELGPGSPPKLTSEPFNISVYSGCPIDIHPPTLVVKYGEAASAECTTFVPHDGIGWNSTLKPVDAVMKDAKSLNWSVSELREWTVKPRCWIETEDVECSKEVNVIAYSAPDSVRVTSSRLGSLAEGKDYTLSCDIRNIAPAQNLTIRWYKGQTKINDTRPHASHTLPEPLNVTSELHIQPHTSDDGAQYRCEAELELGPGSPPKLTSEPFSITVYSGCPIDISPPTLVVKYGESASAVCHASIPHNGIEWNSAVEPVAPVKDAQSLKWSVNELREWTVTPSCWIKTEDMECSKELNVLAYIFPASINMTTSEAGVMTAGNVYTLTCHIQHVAPAQNLNLRWFKGSELQKEDRGPQDSSGGPRDLTFDLQITPDTSDDGAEYRCEAELKLDSVVVQLPKLTSQHLKISVARNWIPPIIIVLIILLLLVLCVLFALWYRRRKRGEYNVVPPTDIPLTTANGGVP